MKKNGVSLVSLVITIIVLIILACGVYITFFGENNIISMAKEAAFKQDMKMLQEQVVSYTMNAKLNDVSADVINSGNTEFIPRIENMKEIMPSLVDKYVQKVAVQKGELYYVILDSENEEIMQEVQWCIEIGIKIKGYVEEEPIIPIPEGTYEEKDGVYVNVPNLTGFNRDCTYYVVYDEEFNLVLESPVDEEEPAKWYDYGEKMWANISTKSNGKTSYWVWIPRYVYKMTYTDPSDYAKGGTVDVRFVDLDNYYTDPETNERTQYNDTVINYDENGQPTNYILHPSFVWDMTDQTYGEGEEQTTGQVEQLAGIWIAKYEMMQEPVITWMNTTSYVNSIRIDGVEAPGQDYQEYEILVNGQRVGVTRTLPFVVENLVEGTEYTIGVRGYFNDQIYTNAYEKQISTLNIGEMENYFVTEITDTTITVKRENIDEISNIAFYYCDIYLDDVLVTQTNNELPYTIENLTPNTTYSVGIRGYYYDENNTPIYTSISTRKVKTLYTDANAVATPNLTGFNTANTYYVTYDESGNTVIGDSIASSAPTGWYDYNSQQWANIVTINNGKMSYWTWIPRYEYYLTNKIEKVELRFIPKEQVVATHGYVIPTSFSWDMTDEEDGGIKQLDGFWTAKYEMMQEPTITEMNTTSYVNSILINSATAKTQDYNKYEVLVNGTSVATPSSLPYEITGLNEGTEYTIGIRMYKNSSTYTEAFTKTASTLNIGTLEKYFILDLTDNSITVARENIADISGNAFENCEIYLDDVSIYSGELPYTITGLEENTKYKIGIRGYHAENGTTVYTSTCSRYAKTLYSDVNDVVEPDLTGYNADTTYYVTYDESGNPILGDNISSSAPSNWYDYTTQQWANIATINNGKLSYWTWIPRYEYYLIPNNSSIQKVELRFIPVSQVAATTGYTIHPSFSWDMTDVEGGGIKQLRGMWIAKYEMMQEPVVSSSTFSSHLTSITVESATALTNGYTSYQITVDGSPYAITNRLPYLIEGLRSGRTYSIGVRMYKDENVYTELFEQEVQTLGSSTLDCYFVTDVTSNTITISRENIDDPSEVSFDTCEIFVGETSVYLGELPYTITGLNANTEYTIGIKGSHEEAGSIVETSTYSRIVKTLYSDVNNVVTPDFTGFNTANTYYVTYDESGNPVIGNSISGSAPVGWYDYNNKQWANIVTISNGKMSYWTWIPRYEYYLIPNNNAIQKVELRFIPVTQVAPTTGYAIHPSFVWDMTDEEGGVIKQLKGMWIAKYEMMQEPAISAASLTPYVNSIRVNSATALTQDYNQYEVLVNGASVHIGTLPYDITGLQEATSYTIGVRMYKNENIYTDPFNQTIKTLDLSKQTKYFVTEITSNTITITRDGILDASDSTWESCEVFVGETSLYRGPLPYTITNLTPNTAYSVGIRGFYRVDGVLYSTNINTRTVKTQYTNINSMVTPDLTGFNAMYTYYVTFDESGNPVVGNKINQSAPTGWYDYNSQKWANVVTCQRELTDNEKLNLNSVNTDIAYWVWIPRYEYYLIPNIKDKIELRFIPVSQIATTNGYTMPRSFIWDMTDDNGGINQLRGFWVSKYEMSNPGLIP